MKTALQRIDKFYHTPWIYVVSIGLVWVISITFGVLPFALGSNGVEWGWGQIDSNGLRVEIYRHDSNAWLGWFILAISLTGATLAVVGEVFVANNSRKYVWPISIARIFTISYCILAKLWFLAVTSFLYALIGIINSKNWDDQGSHLVSKMTINRHVVATLITIAFVAFGLGMTLGQNPVIEDTYPIMDVLFSTMVIIGWLNVSQKNKWGWTVYILSDFGFITLYFLMFSMSFFASATVYLIFDCIAAFRWFNWEYAHYNLADSLVEKYLE